MQPLDTELFSLLNSLPKLPFGKLLRPDHKSIISAKKAFFATGLLPVFTYSRAKNFDIISYQKALSQVTHQITSVPGNKLIKKLYLAKLAELKTKADIIAAVQISDDRTVSQLSKKLFSKPKTDLKIFEQEFIVRKLAAASGKLHKHSKNINAEDFAKLTRTALDYYGLTEWRIKISQRSHLKIGHSKRERSPIIHIPKKLLISKSRASKLLTHEIEVHALRTNNGLHSPLRLLGRGLAGYLQTEEGLALYYQNKLSTKKSSFTPGFFEAWTASLLQKYGFKKAFKIIRAAKNDLAKPNKKSESKNNGQVAAWKILRRFSYGITKPGAPGIGFFKNQIYYEGFLEITKAVELLEAETLNNLFWGNMSLADLSQLKTLNLPPVKTPELISKHLVSKYKIRS